MYHKLYHRRSKEAADGSYDWESPTDEMVERVGIMKVEMDVRGDTDDAGNGSS